MTFTRNRHPERIRPIEITPLIDVVFLLVIFFMVTAQFAQRTRADVELPRELGERMEAVEEARLVINVLANGEVIINDREVPLNELEGFVRERRAALEERYGQADVRLRADRDADTTVLNGVIRSLQRAGVSVARVATEVP